MTQGVSRPPMTFLQQAELLEYLIDKAMPAVNGTASMVITPLDADQIEDLMMTARRLRRMVPHEDAIKRVVTGK